MKPETPVLPIVVALVSTLALGILLKFAGSRRA